MSQILRLRKHFTADQTAPDWPAQTHLQPLAEAEPGALHAILAEAYANGFGSVPPLQTWWSTLTADSEFDADLVIIAANSAGQPIGLAQCWTSGFIKDLAVAPDWRGKGIGETLLRQVSWVLQQRGLAAVELKVVAENTHAIALYRRLGMSQVLL